MRDIVLAGIVGVPGERLRALARGDVHRHLGVSGKAFRLDEGREFEREIAFENVDEEDEIVHQRLAPGVGDLFRLATHVELAQRMRETMRDHRVAAPLERDLEPVERVAERLGLVIVPGDQTRLVRIFFFLGVGLENLELRIRYLLGTFVVQIGADARAHDVDHDRRELAAARRIVATGGDELLDIGHAQVRHRLLDGGEPRGLIGARLQDREIDGNGVVRLLGLGEGFRDRPEHFDVGVVGVVIVGLHIVDEVLPFPLLPEVHDANAQFLAPHLGGQILGRLPVRLFLLAGVDGRAQFVDPIGGEQFPIGVLARIAGRRPVEEIDRRRPAGIETDETLDLGIDAIHLAELRIIAQRGFIGPFAIGGERLGAQHPGARIFSLRNARLHGRGRLARRNRRGRAGDGHVDDESAATLLRERGRRRAQKQRAGERKRDSSQRTHDGNLICAARTAMMRSVAG